MDQGTNKIKSFIKKKISSIAAIGAVMLIYSLAVILPGFGAVVYPPGALLQPEDVTSSHIRNFTIVNVDVSSSSAIGYTKLNLAQGIVDNDVATSSRIDAQKISTSTSYLFVQNSAQTWAGVKTFSSIPATTGGNCAAGNDLCNKTYVDTKGSFATSTHMIPSYTGIYSGTSTLNYSINTNMVAAAYYIPTRITATKIAYKILVVSTAGTLQLGIYSHDGQNKIVDVTTQNIATTGATSTTFTSTTFDPGIYYFALIPKGTSAITLETYNGLHDELESLDNEPEVAVVQTGQTAGTLPATFDPSVENELSIDTPIWRLDN